MAPRVGWRTRDRAWIDADGFVFIEGRSDDTIIRGGERHRAAEIRGLLLAHPGVAEAAVVGLTDEEWGQRVAAAVVARDGASIQPRRATRLGPRSAARLQDPCRDRVLGLAPVHADRQAAPAGGQKRVERGFESPFSIVSTRPHSSAVSASSGLAVRASQSVRWRPMRRLRLTVPPAPGIKPHRQLGKADREIGRRGHVCRKGRQLDAPLRCMRHAGEPSRGQRPGRASRHVALHPDPVGQDRIADAAELGEIAATAKALPGSAQVNVTQRVVDLNQLQRAASRRSRMWRVVGVMTLGPVSA